MMYFLERHNDIYVLIQPVSAFFILFFNSALCFEFLFYEKLLVDLTI